MHVRTYATAGRAEFVEYDKQVRKRIPKDRVRDLPSVPGTDGASNDQAVVAERTRWIEEFFVAAFQYLDERMEKQLMHAADGKNTWEREFSKTTCAPLLPNVPAISHLPDSICDLPPAYHECMNLAAKVLITRWIFVCGSV
jgi:hypothetical protein